MNDLTGQLAVICRQQPLEEKWLLAPTLCVGHQWLDSVAHAGQPVVNVYVKTIKFMAVDFAAGQMAGFGVSLASRRASALLVDRVLAQLRSSGLKYLGDVAAGTRLAETLLAAIEAVRMAGLGAENLVAERFEVAANGEDTYVSLVNETLSAFRHHEDDSSDQLPVTFAEGISCRYARPGRAMSAWLKWM